MDGFVKTIDDFVKTMDGFVKTIDDCVKTIDGFTIDRHVPKTQSAVPAAPRPFSRTVAIRRVA